MAKEADADDPLDQLELEETLVEPLWSDEQPTKDEQEAEREAAECRAALTMPLPRDAESGDAQEASGGETVLMAPQQGDATVVMAPPQGDETVLLSRQDVQDGDGEPEEEDGPETGAPADDDEPVDAGEPAEADEPAEAGETAGERTEAMAAQQRSIDVGEDDGWHVDTDRAYRTSRAFEERLLEDRARRAPSSTWPVPLAVIAALAIVVGFAAAIAMIGRGALPTVQTDVAPLASKPVSRREAREVIYSLDGWWKTDRTYDGRRWHIQDATMRTYAADGKLAREVVLDPSAIEHMDSLSQKVDGPGYYLRDVAYYLLDADQDTLHAINPDGSVNPDANLLRCDPPSYATEGGAKTGDEQEVEVAQAQEQPTDQTSEYLLPESSTRVYEVSELESLSDHDLFVARNEIYARHGYVFDAGELSEYFASKSWYQPSDSFNEGDITEIERQNVSVILQLEQARGSQYV